MKYIVLKINERNQKLLSFGVDVLYFDSIEELDNLNTSVHWVGKDPSPIESDYILFETEDNLFPRIKFEICKCLQDKRYEGIVSEFSIGLSQLKNLIYTYLEYIHPDFNKATAVGEGMKKKFEEEGIKGVKTYVRDSDGEMKEFEV